MKLKSEYANLDVRKPDHEKCLEGKEVIIRGVVSYAYNDFDGISQMFVINVTDAEVKD